MPIGRIASGAADLANKFTTLGGSRQFETTNPQVAQLLRERERREAIRDDPIGFGRAEGESAFQAGNLDLGQSARLARARSRGTSGFQNFSRNVDPLSGRHFLDFVDDANRLAVIQAAMDPSRGPAPNIGGVGGGFGGSIARARAGR